MKFKFRLQQAVIQYDQYLRRMDSILTKHLTRGAQTWLNATVLLAVPIWSGASRATFLKLARAVNHPLTITGIKKSSKKGISSGKDGPRLGFQKSKGEVSLGEREGLYTFTYETDLFRLVFNEYKNANENKVAGRVFNRLIEPGPYGFQQVGQAAFADYTKHAVELPSPWRNTILKIKRLRVG
jgi:hypothetical protein